MLYFIGLGLYDAGDISMGFGTAQGILTGVFQGYKDDIVTEVQNRIQGTPGAQPHQFIQTEVEGM